MVLKLLILLLPLEVLRIKFHDINSELEANSIVNCEIYLPLNSLPVLKGNKFYYHDVINYLVVDENFGEVGKIKNIKENISQDLFVIDYKSNDVLIPIHDEFIINVDRDKKQIIVKTPEGLIDLYINS